MYTKVLCGPVVDQYFKIFKLLVMKNFINIKFFPPKLGAELVPVELKMKDNSTFYGNLGRIWDNSMPAWMFPGYVPLNYYVYVRTEDNENWAATVKERPGRKLPGHNPAHYGPSSAEMYFAHKYMKAENFHFYHFEHEKLTLDNFPLGNHVYVTMPRCPKYSSIIN